MLHPALFSMLTWYITFSDKAYIVVEEIVRLSGNVGSCMHYGACTVPAGAFEVCTGWAINIHV